MARRLKSSSALRARRAQRAAVIRLATQFYFGPIPDDFYGICRAAGVNSTEVMREIYQRRMWSGRPAGDSIVAPEAGEPGKSDEA